MGEISYICDWAWSTVATLVPDMDNGLRKACTELHIKPRECLTHIHARLEKMHVFIRGHRESIGPFLKFAKVGDTIFFQRLLPQVSME